MLNRLTIATFCALLVGLFAVGTATAAPDRAPTPPPTNFWQNKNFMNMAHQGGETEAPGNTLFAFKTAVADRGADTVEMDGYLTEDGVFVITHDLDPYKTSNAPGETAGPDRVANQINNQTLAELKQLDFAYKFRPGTGHYGYPHGGAPAEEYIYRGIATGEKPPPTGYTANDFKIPTFEEVLDALPDTPINVDMKAPGNNQALANAAAEEMADIMAAHPERSEDVIVASFAQGAMETFRANNTTHKALSGSEQATLSYVQGNPLVPTPVAVQPPDRYSFGGTMVETVPLLKPHADHDGFAIHVWPANGSPDDETTWQKVIDQGADGFFTDKPGAMHEYLCETGVPRPDGTPRCDTQICPEGQEGIAPNDCQPIPCPAGTSGTPPNCEPFCPDVLKYGTGRCEVDQTTTTKKVAISPVKGKIKPGKKVNLTIKVTATPGMASKTTVSLKSSNRQVKLPKSVKVSFKYSMRPATVKKTITVKATRKAKGKAKITATAQGKKGTATLTVKKAKRARN